MAGSRGLQVANTATEEPQSAARHDEKTSVVKMLRCYSTTTPYSKACLRSTVGWRENLELNRLRVNIYHGPWGLGFRTRQEAKDAHKLPVVPGHAAQAASIFPLGGRCA